MQHIFIIGAKSIGQYGGYETFLEGLVSQHENESQIKYHIACKANGDGCMDESKLSRINILKKDDIGNTVEFEYKNAHVFKVPCPSIGPAVAIYYDKEALRYSIDYCKKNQIEQPIFYILTCRIGLFINYYVKKMKSVGGAYYINPDGHEWMRKKWNIIIRCYWKWSEKRMVNKADLVICDSKNIEKYIKKAYSHPNTTYISYGVDLQRSKMSDDDADYISWMTQKKVKKKQYYLVVGRFVPENNYEIIIKEFLRSKTTRDLVIVTNCNHKFMKELEKKLFWKEDDRIKFVGTVYNRELLKKIRENAYAYIHGHEVGGTNPSLLEALVATDLNLLFDVCFNREVGGSGLIYWNKNEGDLSSLINKIDELSLDKSKEFGYLAKTRIENQYSWVIIGDAYKKIWLNREV